ncbi:MAG: response regulator transcription factor [Ekhidna sp.]|nr:response regulator transcription factor [Ekhidna sp.]MBC6409783.1 response regulator transcription factor [Ekhidna sp.]MBC6426356.1 response regulator transcription factor [Ekhidna sp.]
MKPRLLIVEDDPNLGEILSEYLGLKGFETTLKRDGEEGERAFKEGTYDLCILDLMMPKKDGFSLAKEIRSMNEETPIIFLTAKSMKQDIIKGFTIGADDYMTKPFSMEELLLRIQAVLKRYIKKQDEPFPNEFAIASLTYYYWESRLVTRHREINLTTKENELMKIFFENLNQMVVRSIALKKIWKDDSYFNARSMDVYIAKIRKYLADDPSLKLLTIHGEGFRLVQVK